MNWPTPHDETVRTLLTGGRTAGHAELAERGVNRMAVTRLVRQGVLVRSGWGVFALAQELDGDPLPALAARYGAGGGVLCLQAAAVLHGLTDMGWHNLAMPEVALPRTSRLGRDARVPVRIVRVRHPYHRRHLEDREFGGKGLRVTAPARTACDLFAPWAGNLPEGLADDVLGRLLASGPQLAADAVGMAEELGWGRTMASAYEAMRAAVRHRPARRKPDEGHAVEAAGLSL